MAGGGPRVASIILAIIGSVLFAVGLVAAVSTPGFIVGGGGCGTSCPQIGNLVGYVTNQSSGSGIVGALVRLYVSGSLTYSATTTTNGYYQLGAITAGGYLVNVTAAGYKPVAGNVLVSPGVTASFSAQLAPLSSSGSSGGQGCSPLPTGGTTCAPPPPPPGVSPPPPITNTTTRTNTTTKVTPSPSSVLLILAGSVFLVVAAAVWKG